MFEYSVFPLNGPIWSLSLEAVANAAFAISCRRRIGLIVIIATLALCIPSLAWGVWAYGDIDFGSQPVNYWLGYSRVGWSFSAGVLLYRFEDFAPRMPFFVPAVALVALMLAPPSLGIFGQSFDLFSVLFALPAVVWAASTAHFGSMGQRWSAWSGDLSYPVYTLHYPVIRALAILASKLGLTVLGRLSIAAASTALIISAAAVVYSFLDVPVRRLLTSRLA